MTRQLHRTRRTFHGPNATLYEAHLNSPKHVLLQPVEEKFLRRVAASAGDARFVRYLLDRGIDPSTPGHFGLPALGSVHNYEDIAMMLLEAGTSMSSMNDKGEPPFFRTAAMGSAVHAKDLKTNGVGLRAMISLEMIGYFSDQDGSQTLPSVMMGAFYPSRGNFVAVVGNIGSGLLVREIKAAMMKATFTTHRASSRASITRIRSTTGTKGFPR